jgi:hypothetical protein
VHFVVLHFLQNQSCHPGQAMRTHRAEPGPIVPAAQWVPGLAALARDDSLRCGQTQKNRQLSRAAMVWAQFESWEICTGGPLRCQGNVFGLFSIVVLDQITGLFGEFRISSADCPFPAEKISSLNDSPS